jgi:hypothetical protein
MSVVKDFEKFKRFNFGQLQTDASQVGADDTLKLNEQKQEKKEKQEKQETQETQETQEVEADIRGIEKADTIKTQDSEKEVTTT